MEVLKATGRIHGSVLASKKNFPVFWSSGDACPLWSSDCYCKDVGDLPLQLVLLDHWQQRCHLSHKYVLLCPAERLPGRVLMKVCNDADLISLITKLISKLRRPCRPEWVQGHQDSHRSYYETMPIKTSCLNTGVDFLVTEYLLQGWLKSSSQIDHQMGQKISIPYFLISKTINGDYL